MLEKIKQAIQGRMALSQQWVDMVADDKEKTAKKIEEDKGPEAAAKYRTGAEKTIQKLQGRVDSELTEATRRAQEGRRSGQ